MTHRATRITDPDDGFKYDGWYLYRGYTIRRLDPSDTDNPRVEWSVFQDAEWPPHPDTWVDIWPTLRDAKAGIDYIIDNT